MEIIVCIKQVPDTTNIKIDPVSNTLIRAGVPSIINPFDMYAIEEGLRIKEKHGGKVTVISMGPPQVEEAFKEAVSLGVDECVLLSDRKFAGADTWATSYTLAKGILHIGNFDIIICGKQAIDGDTAQVGPGIAEFINIPQATYVKKISEIKDNSITVERMTDTGYDILSLSIPCMLTVVKDINEPRLPSLRGKMRARKYNHETLSAVDLNLDEKDTGLEGSPTRVVKIFSPALKGSGEILEGETETVVPKLIEKLKSYGIVK